MFVFWTGFYWSPDSAEAILFPDQTALDDYVQAHPETALEEGQAPLMLWTKLMIDDVIQSRMGHADLEFDWTVREDIDPKVQSDIVDQKLHSGRLTLNEARKVGRCRL
jgi:hypothetical protein